MEILDIVSWEIPYTRPPTIQEYEHFAKLTEWQIKEAVMLSLGYHPNRQGARLEKSEAERIGLLVRDRWDLVDKAMRSGDLPYKERRYKLGSETREYIIEARTYVNWIQANKLSCPEALINAVQSNDPYLVRTTDPIAVSSPEENAETPTELPDNRDERSRYSSELGKRKGLTLRELKANITSYAEGELNRGCICMHREQAYYLMKLKRADGRTYFEDPRTVSQQKVSFRDKVIEATKKAHRNKGKAIYGDPGFQRTPGQCPVHRNRKK